MHSFSLHLYILCFQIEKLSYSKVKISNIKVTVQYQPFVSPLSAILRICHWPIKKPLNGFSRVLSTVFLSNISSHLGPCSYVREKRWFIGYVLHHRYVPNPYNIVLNEKTSCFLVSFLYINFKTEAHLPFFFTQRSWGIQTFALNCIMWQHLCLIKRGDKQIGRLLFEYTCTQCYKKEFTSAIIIP